MVVSGRLLPKLCPDRTLFLLCDIQEKFRKAIPLFANLLVNTNKLLKVGKEFEVPVIATEQYPQKLGKTCEELDRSAIVGICPKTKFSMYVPELVSLIREHTEERPKDVVLFGVESHVCVLQTAMDFLDNNYKVHIVVDCVASRTNQDRDVALRVMRDIGCFLQTSESIAFGLLEDKANEEFKTVSTLVSKTSEDMQIAHVPSGGPSHNIRSSSREFKPIPDNPTAIALEARRGKPLKNIPGKGAKSESAPKKQPEKKEAPKPKPTGGIVPKKASKSPTLSK